MQSREENEPLEERNRTDTDAQTEHLSAATTFKGGLLMGFLAYSSSFAVAPILATAASLAFGAQSTVAIVMTAIGPLLAGYLHTHSSRAGMVISRQRFDDFYMQEATSGSRRLLNESRWNAFRRFFCDDPINAAVLNFMWQTYTVCYLLQTELYLLCRAAFTSEGNADHERDLVLFNGIARYLAGCVAGMSTGVINHLWQRHRAQKRNPRFRINRQMLTFDWETKKNLLSPCNVENWIKMMTMLGCALCLVLSQIPNPTGFHALTLRQKRIIIDCLVINGGWFFLRDGAMLMLTKVPQPTVVTPIDEHQPIANEGHV